MNNIYPKKETSPPPSVHSDAKYMYDVAILLMYILLDGDILMPEPMTLMQNMFVSDRLSKNLRVWRKVNYFFLFFPEGHRLAGNALSIPCCPNILPITVN